ncbi:hypothetical protein SBA2_630030 [Acidobacteriia bacterium SbA2]|nr:hypothetical protein SBA2_630030 [Acidobacteriia bacterium SbA2]
MGPKLVTGWRSGKWMGGRASRWTTGRRRGDATRRDGRSNDGGECLTSGSRGAALGRDSPGAGRRAAQVSVEFSKEWRRPRALQPGALSAPRFAGKQR